MDKTVVFHKRLDTNYPAGLNCRETKLKETVVVFAGMGNPVVENPRLCHGYLEVVCSTDLDERVVAEPIFRIDS